MPRGKMSEEAKRRISEAAKKRWAKYRTAKASGKLPAGMKHLGRRPGRPPKAASMSVVAAVKGRRGRPPKAVTISGNNPYLNMTIADLVTAKQQIDEAWSLATRMLRA